MTDALSIAELSMRNDMQRLNVISNNLANVKTTAYKRQVVTNKAFSVVLSSIKNTAGGMSVKGTSPTIHMVKDMGGGAVQTTNNPLDLVISEPTGYFVVSTRNGMALTRKGNFKISLAGILTTASGMAVMGVNGPIRLNGNNPAVDQYGIVRENGKQVGELLLVQSKSSKEMVSLGNGLYKTNAKNYQASKFVRVRQGYLEASNVVLMKEMVDMMQLVRHFEASQKLLVSYDQMIGQAINSIGDV